MTDITNPTRQSFVIPALGGLYASTSDLAEAGLRVATALFLLPHGVQKLFGWMGGYGLEATSQFFQTQLGFANGYLAALSAGVVETFVALALALGLATRVSAGIILVFLSVAVTVHWPNGFFNANGGWEFPVLWAILAGYFVVKGGGRYSVDRLIGREI